MKLYKLQLFTVLTILTNLSLYSQVGIGTTSPDVSSVLDLTSTTQGVLTPRMTTVQRNAISSPGRRIISV